jgi:hypothetical protein
MLKMPDRFNAKTRRIEVQIELQEELPAQCKEIRVDWFPLRVVLLLSSNVKSS